MEEEAKRVPDCPWSIQRAGQSEQKGVCRKVRNRWGRGTQRSVPNKLSWLIN